MDGRKTAHLPYKVVCVVREVVRAGNIFVRKKIWIWVVRLIAVLEEQLEEMEEANKIEPSICALHYHKHSRKSNSVR